ncbi:MAG: four helix bundle protein [Chitinophagaceae bacterium]|nr:MAG: four helix bundle protein [Chitinophagaceae bacterium]
MNRADLERRTKKFNVDVIRLCLLLPRNAVGFELGKQLVRSSGSVGSNYRASRRAKSHADFICKIEIVLEEADESHYWLEVIKESELLEGTELDRLIQEAYELTAIFSATDKTAKSKGRR